MLQGKIDYKNVCILYALFLAPKIENCLSIYDYGFISGHEKFTGCSEVNRNLDTEEKYKLFDGEKLFTKRALSWKN